MEKNTFVFVACGDDIHINTLNFSLKYLRRFSRQDILVVTDLSRNRIPIDHDNVLNVDTDKAFDHHQASIYLKVGLHQFLDMSQSYCYLDSDVIALSPDVDQIFSHYSAPISFASDHCSVTQFSPNAMNCNCSVERDRTVKQLQQLEEDHKDELEKLKQEHALEWAKFVDRYGFDDPDLMKKYEEVIALCADFGKRFNRLTRKPLLKFILSHTDEEKYNFEYAVESTGKFRWDRKERKIYDTQNNLIFNDHDKFDYEKYKYVDYYTYIADKTGYVWDASNTTWRFTNGKEVYIAQCDHLKEAILKKFDVKVGSEDWTHWNGGVFMFDQESVPFLDLWLKNTLEIFKDPHWKTRDQGTLISTIWNLGLENQSRIPSEFNLLADAQNEALRFHPKKGISLDGSKTFTIPKFAHIYHDFGKKGWEVWDYIEDVGGEDFESSEFLGNHALSADNKVVNGLWIGTELSSIELLTLSSFINNGHEFHLWIYDEITTPLPENVILKDASKIIPRDQVFSYKKTNQFGHGKGSFAGFSDIFRYKLLYEKGGWWMDMDVCCLKPLELEGAYVFREHHQLPAVGNMMKCPKGSEVMKACYEEAISTVGENNTDWHKPITILNKHIENYGLTQYIQNISNTDNWSDIVPLLNAKEVPVPDWYAIHWANENWRARNVKKTEFVKGSHISKLMLEYDIKHDVTEKPVNVVNRLSFESIFGRLRKLAMMFGQY